MFVRSKLAALASVTVFALGLATAPAEAALRTVKQQAEVMNFSSDMLAELGKFFPGDELGVGRIEEPEAETVSAAATHAGTRTVRIIKTRQKGQAVTDEEMGSSMTRYPKAARSPGRATPSRAPTLFVEESRDLEDRLGRDIATQLRTKGYEVQAINVKLESLTSVKVVLLATLSSLTGEQARDKLIEVRDYVEHDVLKPGYPNMSLTRASSINLASASGSQVVETSAMLYELEREDFAPTVRQKTVAVPVEKADEPSHSPKTSARKSRTAPAVRVERAPVPTEPTAVSLAEKEKTEKARQEKTKEAAPAPASTGVQEKARQETITPSESDFQD
jgi:hypothetical protein